MTSASTVVHPASAGYSNFVYGDPLATMNSAGVLIHSSGCIGAITKDAKYVFKVRVTPCGEQTQVLVKLATDYLTALASLEEGTPSDADYARVTHAYGAVKNGLVGTVRKWSERTGKIHTDNSGVEVYAALIKQQLPDCAKIRHCTAGPHTILGKCVEIRATRFK